MEVYDGVAGPGRTDARQLRIDCEHKIWAIGETRTFIDEVPVPTPKLNKDGWKWMPFGDQPPEKLIDIVCEGKIVEE